MNKTTWPFWVIVFIVAASILLFVFYNLKRYNDNIPQMITEKAFEENCEYVSIVEGKYTDMIDCYEPVLYNRAVHLNKSGMYCYFTEAGTFLNRCKW